MKGRLYVVATPIGNLEDLSPRGLRVLTEVNWIACEDTRHSGKLLKHFGITTPTVSYHDHNEASRTHYLLRLMEEGADVALISDAGTPLVSDPGYRLLEACREKQIPVTTVPGPCAATAALSISGIAADQFYFAGFLPTKAATARKKLESVKAIKAALIFYLSPHRLVRELDQIVEQLGNRQACLVRELTKLHEDSLRGSLIEVRDQADSQPVRGEYTLVVAGADEVAESPPPIDIEAYVEGLKHHLGLSHSEAVRRAAGELKLVRRQLYRQLLE